MHLSERFQRLARIPGKAIGEQRCNFSQRFLFWPATRPNPIRRFRPMTSQYFTRGLEMLARAPAGGGKQILVDTESKTITLGHFAHGFGPPRVCAFQPKRGGPFAV